MRNLILAVFMVAVTMAQAQAQPPKKDSCVSALAPCTPFINSTTLEPTSECCKPLYNALNSTLTCVCSIYGNSDFIQKLKFNAKAVLSLPMRCGLEFDLLSGCAAPSTPALSPASDGPSSDGDSLSPATALDADAPTTTVTTTPSPSGSKSAATSNIALSGFTILGSFLIWTTMMLY